MFDCERNHSRRPSVRLIATSFALAAAALTLAASPALAFDWSYVSETKELIGTTGEEEGDTDFRASCLAGGKANIGIGAAEDIGKGEGEAVSVTLTAGATSLTIEGKSGKSPNFEMTAGVELQTQVDGGHAIFTLLGEKGAIKVTGPIKTTWPEKGRVAATKAFVKACFGK
jgi:hypothetical protein